MLRAAGGTASAAILRRESGLSRSSLYRRLKELLAGGEVIRLQDGGYRLATFEDGLTESATEIVHVLRTAGYPAHLTGLDLLRPFAHQFTYEFPHLVLAAPGAAESAMFDLAGAGFVTQPVAMQHATPPMVGQLVLVGRQSTQEAARLGVRDHVAPPQKAWLDLLHEALRDRYPVSLLELGRILANMRESGIDMDRLVRSARRMRLEHELNVALGCVSAPTSRLEALAVGCRS